MNYIETNITDNTTGAITPEILRNVLNQLRMECSPNRKLLGKISNQVGTGNPSWGATLNQFGNSVVINRTDVGEYLLTYEDENLFNADTTHIIFTAMKGCFLKFEVVDANNIRIMAYDATTDLLADEIIVGSCFTITIPYSES